MSNINLAELTFETLAALKPQLDAEIASRRTAALDAARQELQERAKALGVDPSDLLQKAPKAAKARKSAGTGSVAPKYRDSAGNTWTGRGKQPVWLRNAIAAGASLDSFKIPA